jgi:hypothetical protein
MPIRMACSPRALRADPGSQRFNPPCTIGWEQLRFVVTTPSRLASSELLPHEREEDCTAFLQRAHARFDGHSVHTERVITDNRLPRPRFGGSPIAPSLPPNPAGHGIAHKRTRPYTPRTNGKSLPRIGSGAERFIQTSLREWAYA